MKINKGDEELMEVVRYTRTNVKTGVNVEVYVPHITLWVSVRALVCLHTHVHTSVSLHLVR